MVPFRQHNLLDAAPMDAVGIVFCRNLLMYFNSDFAQKAGQTHYPSVDTGGWLLMGQAEALHSCTNNWTLHLHPGSPIYQKTSGTKPLSAPISNPTRPFVEFFFYSTTSTTEIYTLSLHDALPI